MDIQEQIASLQVDIDSAKASIAKAMQDRRAINNKDSPLTADCNAAIAAAKEALLKVEVQLRKLYESKDDGE